MKADIGLILEGTYPFVFGGVSSWMHQIVSSLPDLTFSITHISPKRGFYSSGPVYDLPPNVVGVEELYLHDYAGMPSSLNPEFFSDFIRDLRRGSSESLRHLLHQKSKAARASDPIRLLESPEGWDVLVETYREEASEESFLNFFWTWRYTYLPLINILNHVPHDVGLFHTICTGYAGLLASSCKAQTQRPMLLTEHGIYTKERRIEINRARWIADWDSGEIAAERRAPYFKQFWIRQFTMMSRICYENADRILTIYTGNMTEQIRDGADPERIQVIPNGIDVDRFSEAAQRRDAEPDGDVFVVGFIGRISPIKDLKTFLDAIRLAVNHEPNLRARILGPDDEDPAYGETCRVYSRQLGLMDHVRFEGRVRTIDELPHLDVLVLTSISEAQPLVILEAAAVGVPFIATDVGACAELARGRTAEDQALGVGGLITPIATPGDTARAITHLAAHRDLAREMGCIMRKRANRFYALDDMIDRYRDLYDALETHKSWPALASN